MIKVIKRKNRTTPKKRDSKDHRQRNSASQIKKTVASWVYEFKSKRNESRLVLVGSLTTHVNR